MSLATGQELYLYTGASAGTSMTVSVTWGDGGTNSYSAATTGAMPTAQHSYSTTGSYTISVSASNSQNSQSTSAAVDVDQAISGLSASANDPTLSLGQTLSLYTSVSSGSSMTVSVNWGDGASDSYSATNTGSMPTPQHSYSGVGSYTISVAVTNPQGGQSTSVVVTADASISGVSASASDNTLEVGQSLSLYLSASAGSNMAISVNWGDGGSDSYSASTTSSLPTPTHSYSSAGSYTVSVTITNSVGSGSTSVSVTADTSVGSVSASASDPTLETGQTLSMSLSVSAGSSMTIAVDWGDSTPPDSYSAANTGSLPTPQHSYSAAGSYTVSITVSNSQNSQSTSVSVTADTSVGSVSASASDSDLETGQTLSLTLSVSAGSSMTIAVDWGDSTSDSYSAANTGSLPTPQHSYSAAGSYTISITVSNSQNSQSTSVSVTADQSIAGLSASADDETLEVNQGVSLALSVSAGSSMTIAVDWGDSTSDSYSAANTGSLPTPQHSYTAVGSYTVSITVSNSQNSESTSVSVTADTSVGSVSASASDSDLETGQTLSLTLSVSAGSSMTIAVDWGDSTSDSYSAANTGSLPTPQHSYSAAGSYTVSIEVSNSQNSQSTSVSVTADESIAGLSASADDATLEVNQGVSLSLSLSSGSDMDISVDWGDSNSDTLSASSTRSLPTPTHSYPNVGSYTITVTISNSQNSESTSVTVTADTSVAGLSASASDITLELGQSLSVSLTLTAGSNLDISVDWGDSNSDSYSATDQSSLPTPQHSYSISGSHTVSVTVTNSQNSESTSVTVDADAPLAGLAASPSDSALEIGQTLSLTLSVSTGTNMDISVDWGDSGSDSYSAADTGSLPTPQHVFTSVGTFTITITITNTQNSVSTSLTLSADAAIAGLAASPDDNTLEVGQTLSVTLSLTAGSNMAISMDWGDSNSDSLSSTDISSLPTPAHAYASAGTYTVTVTISNSQNTETSSFSIESDISIVDPTFSATHIQSGSPITAYFTASSGTRITVNWDFGNSDSDSGFYTDYTSLPSEASRFEYSYGDNIGVFTVTVQLSNSVSTHTLTATAANTMNAASVAITASDPVSTDSPTVTFTQTMSAGRHLTCTRDYGDGTSDSTTDDNPGETVTYSHTYPSVRGTYDFALECTNDYLGNPATATKAIEVLFTITGGGFDDSDIQNDGWKNWIYEDAFSFGFYLGAGTSATCTVLLDGSDDTGSLSYTPVQSGGSTGSYSKSGSVLALGEHTVQISCSNVLGSYDLNSFVSNIQKTVQGLTLVPIITYLQPGENFLLFANTTEGSHISYQWQLGDGSGDQSTAMTSAEGDHQELLRYSYSSPGYYTVTVTATNDVSSASETYSIGVEYSVPEDIYLTAVNTTRPTERVLFTIHQPSPPTPTSVITTWYFLNVDIEDLVETSQLSDVNPHETWHEYTDYGDFVCKVCVSNNLSSVCIMTPVRVGIKLQGFAVSEMELDINTYEVNVEAKLRGEVAKGSTVEYAVIWDDDFADVENFPRNQSLNWDSLDLTWLTHTYTEAKQQVKIIVRSVGNTFTTEDESLEDKLVFYIKVDQQVTANSLNSTHKYAKVGELIDFLIIAHDGTSVSSFISYGDGHNSTETPHGNFFAALHDKLEIYDYAYSGNYTPVAYSVNVRSARVNTHGINYIGSITGTGSQIIVQTPITSIALASNASVIAVPYGTVLLHITDDGPLADNGEHPTDIFCNWVFPDGTSDQTFAGNLIVEHEHSHTFPPSFVGTHTINVNCSNYISFATASVTLVFEQTIEGGMTYPVDVIVPSGTPVNFSVNVAKGSHLYFEVDYYGILDVDGTRKETHISPNILNGSVLHDFSHILSIPGSPLPFRRNITINVLIYNNVSSITVSQEAIIQVPLTEESITGVVRGPVQCPDCSMEFILISDSTNLAYPDNVFFRWAYLGDNNTDEVVDFLTSAQIQAGGDILVRPHIFEYNTENRITTLITANNLVSSIVISIDVVLVRAIENYRLTFIDNQYNGGIETGTEVFFNASVLYGSDVLYTLSRGDGIITEPFQTSGDGNSHLFPITCNTVGNFTLNGTASNLVSNSMSTNIPIFVQNRIEDVTLECSAYVLMDRSNGIGDFNVTLIYGETEPSNVVVKFNPDTSALSSLTNDFIRSWPYLLSYQYLYEADMNANPNVSIGLTNMISNITLECNPQIQDKLVELDVIIEQNIVMTGNITNIEVTTTFGSYFTVTFNYGDELEENRGKYQPEDNIAFSHVFDNPGVYLIEAHAQNDVSELRVTKNIYVFNPVPDYVLLSNSTSAVGSIFNLELKKSDISLEDPTNATVTIDWGDLSPLIVQPLDITNEVQASHSYLLTGFYQIMVNVSNPINESIVQHAVIVEVEIRDLEITIMDLDSGTVYNEEDTIPAGAPLVLLATVSQGTDYRGTNLTCNWVIHDANNLPIGTTFITQEVHHAFEVPAEYILIVNMTNTLGGPTLSRRVTIIDDVAVREFSYNTSSIINQTVVFSVQTMKSADEVCFEILLNSTTEGAGVIMFWFGTSQVICESNNNNFEVAHFEAATPGAYFTYSYVFPIEAVYAVYLRVITAYTQGTLSRSSSDITIQGKPCFPPILSLQNNEDGVGLDPNNPIKFLKQYEISAPKYGYNVGKDCEATSRVTEVWKMFKMTDSGEEIEISITDPDYGPGSYQMDRIVFPAMLMPYGLYHFNLNVSMEGHPDKGDALDFYVLVESSELITSLTDSSRVGGDFQFSVSVERDTYDPDVGVNNKEGLVYEWICSRMADEEGDHDDLIDMDYVTNHYDQLSTVNVPVGDAGDARGFCNGTQAGKLNIMSSNLTFFTGHMKSDKKYRLILRVSKDNRVAIRSMELEVVPGNPPQSEFRCHDPNLNDHINFCSWNVISPVYAYYFMIRCTSCTSSQRYVIVIVIEILSQGRSGRKKRSVASEILDMVIETEQADGSHLYQIPANVIPPGYQLKFSFTVQVEGLQEGLFSVVMESNGLPHSGTFTVDPIDAYAIATDVSFQQSGWEAYVPDLTVTLQYIYEICRDYRANPPADCINKTSATTQFSREGMIENGNKTGVRMYMIDDYDTVTVTDFVEVVVHPQPPGAAEEKLNNINEVSNPAAFMDLLGTLAGSLSDPEVTETTTTEVETPSTGGNYAQQTAAQAAAAEAAEAAAAAQRQREQAMLSTMINSMVAFAVGNDEDAPPLTSEQIMMSIATTASLAKKMQKTQDSDNAQSGSLNIMSTMAGSFSTLPPEAQAAAANGLFSVAGSVLDSMSMIVVVAIPEPVDLDVIPDEAAAEEAARLEAEAAARQQQAGLNAVSQVQGTINSIANGMRTSLEEDVTMVIGDSSLQVSIQKSTAGNLAGAAFASVAGTVELPGNLSTGEDGGALFFQITAMTSNVWSWDESAAAVSTGVTQMSLTNEDGVALAMDNLEDNPLIVGHETPEGASNMAELSNISRDSVSNLIYFHIDININNSAYIMCLMPQDINVRFGLYIQFNVTGDSLEKPNKTLGEHHFSVVQTAYVYQYCIVIPQEHIYYPGFYMGLDVFIEDVEPTKNDSIPEFDMNSVISRCRAWDQSRMKWVNDKCKVGARSTTAKTECECKEMSPTVNTFAGGVTVPKVNTIDFANVFGNFASLLTANPTVFAVILGILLLYALIGVWARFRDKKDVEKWGVFPMVGNKKGQDVYYKISIFTGMRQNSGTKSKVCFILSGDKGDTGVRIADDARGKFFTRGSVRHFVMATEFDIGTPTFLRIWHDNSGEGSYGGWFLDKLAVENLNTKKRWFFFCSRWLAADEDDGQVDRMIPLAGSEELENFNKLFFSKTRKNLTDDHLWVSILSRPTKSSFTRLQRLTCCVSLLFTTMIANAMFFRTSSEDAANEGQPDTQVQIGPIILSVNTLLVSIFGSLIIVPPNLIIVQFFRKSKPKNWKSEDEDELAEIKEKSKGKDAGKEQKEDENAPKKKKQRIWKMKYPLPHFCIYIAWTIAVLSIAVPAFFVILYSLDWGETKSLEWLSSLVLSFAQSVVLVQPLKIVVLAAGISLLFKTFDELDDEKENKETNAKPLTDEKLDDTNKMIKLTQAPIAYIPQPPSSSNLERTRMKRAFEKKMWAIVKEVVFYFAFLVLISFIAWGNKDDVVYKMNTHVKNTINFGEELEDMVKGDEVLTGHDYWKWLNETAIPSIFNDVDDAGNPTTSRDRGFMTDLTSYRVGAVRLRQSRVLPGSCDVPTPAAGLILECNEMYSSGIAETRNFSVGWYINSNASYIDEGVITKLQKSFIYYSMFDLKGLPYWGWMGTYSGGGYVAELGTSSYQSHKLITQLIEESWIDYYTRAVFLEFTIYNPNINLFAYVNYLMEFPATGGVIPSERITSFQVYSAVGGVGSAVVAAQLIYCIVFIYFIVRELLKMKNQKKAYWKEPWNYIELSIIIGSIVAISMYVLREKFGRIIMNQLKDNKDGYTNYSSLAVYNEYIDCVIGLLVYLANIKFLKLLRFNKSVNELTSTFRHAGKDLMYFFLTLFIIIMAFGIWGMVIFGKKLYTFSTWVYTCETMLSMLIGKFDLHEMDMADRNLGKVYFVLFTLMVFFILVNMFLGILTMAHQEVRNMPVNPMADYKIIGFLIKKIKKLFRIPVKSEEHGEGYMQPTDVIQMRLTAIDQHVTNLYNESVRLKMHEKEVKTAGKETTRKNIRKVGNLKLALKKPTVYKPNPNNASVTSPVNKPGITNVVMAFKKPNMAVPYSAPEEVTDIDLTDLEDVKMVQDKPQFAKLAMGFGKKPATYQPPDPNQ